MEEYQAENARGDAVDSDLLKLLNLGRGLGTEDREVQRVVQVKKQRIIFHQLLAFYAFI